MSKKTKSIDTKAVAARLDQLREALCCFGSGAAGCPITGDG